METTKMLPPDLLESKGLTVYPNKAAKSDQQIPHYHLQVAKVDDSEDADYYKDVNNITNRGSNWNNPFGLMIRLSAESAGFFQGSGLILLGARQLILDWNSYENYIGARILYPGYCEEIKSAVFESWRLKEYTLKCAVEELRKNGITPPLALETARRNTRKGANNGLCARLSALVYGTSTSTVDEPIDHYRKELEKQMNHTRALIVKYIDSIVAHMSNKSMVRVGAFFVNNMLVRMYNQGIHIKESEFFEVRKAAIEAEKNKHSLIFLPCHKSHVDYIVISYMFYRLGIALPHIAAGDNLNIPLVGWFLKNGGAFFLRRSFGDDPLYSEVFKEYVELLLRRGFNIEVFIEGTRSRMGKLLGPKFGVLKIILDSLLDNKVDDAIIVPMSIGYDKVIETESYVSELLGVPKKKETLVGVLNSASLLSLKLGRIDIRFAKPFSLKQWIAQQIQARSTATSVLDPRGNKKHRVLLLQSVGYRVLSDINSVSVIMPTALVGTIILTLRGRGVGFEELVRRVTWLRREILLKGGRVADFGGVSVAEIVERAIHALDDTIAVRQNLLEPIYYATKRFELSLYRNQVIHLFVHEAFICAAMYSTVKKGRTHRRIFRDALLADVLFLSRLLKKEFIFRPGPVETNVDKSVCVLYEHRVLDLEDAEGKPVEVDVDPRTVWEKDSNVNLATDFFVRLSDRERAIGRENFDFYCFLIWPFIETYWLAAASLFCLVPTPKRGGITEKQLMDRVQHFAKTLYYEGDLGYFESINKETLKNAFKQYEEMGFMVSRYCSEEEKLSGHHHQHHPQQNKPSAKRELLFAVAPEYEAEAVQFLDESTEKSPYAKIYAEGDNPILSGDQKVYQTRLWDFVEQIGRFRREGKHRRDNEVSGTRTLRLARMARDYHTKGKDAKI